MTYKIKGEMQGLLNDSKSDNLLLLLSVENVSEIRNCYDDLCKDVVSVEIKKYSPKRSLSSNAYCFTLIDKLSAKLNIPKTEIYRNAIKEIGGVSDVVCVKNEAVEKLCENWSKNGLGWQTETIPSKIKGCTNVILYYGSSTYNSVQMNALITNIVEECKQQGVETKTPEEIMKLDGLL